MIYYRTKAYTKGLVALPIGEPLDASLNLGNVFAKLVSHNPSYSQVFVLSVFEKMER